MYDNAFPSEPLPLMKHLSPVLREHALFALSNLLKGNPDNQTFVEEIKPQSEWDESGMLQNKFGAMKVK